MAQIEKDGSFGVMARESVKNGKAEVKNGKLDGF